MSPVLPDPPSTPWGARRDFQDFFSYITAISSSLNLMAAWARRSSCLQNFFGGKKGNSELFSSLLRDSDRPSPKKLKKRLWKWVLSLRHEWTETSLALKSGIKLKYGNSSNVWVNIKGKFHTVFNCLKRTGCLRFLEAAVKNPMKSQTQDPHPMERGERWRESRSWMPGKWFWSVLYLQVGMPLGKAGKWHFQEKLGRAKLQIFLWLPTLL